DDVTPRVRAAEFIFRRQQHDRGEKTVLGKTVQTGEDVVKVLCEHPQTAKYITKKLWEWFAYPDPEPAVLERVSTKFYESGLDIKVVLREIMESPEFYSERAERKVFKNPIDFV